MDFISEMVRDLLAQELEQYPSLRAAYFGNAEVKACFRLVEQTLYEVVWAMKHEGLNTSTAARVVRDTWAEICKAQQRAFEQRVDARVRLGEPKNIARITDI